MAITNNVEIYIVATATGKRLQEYDDPKRDETEDQDRVEKYIEAESNVEFGTVVVLKAGFNYYTADGVDVTYRFDGDPATRKYYYPKPEVNVRSSKLLRDVTYKRDSMKVERSRNWYTVNYSFGAVNVDEDLHSDQDKLTLQMNKLGTINVKVQRVKREDRKNPLPPPGGLPEGIGGLDKKLLVNSITHTFQQVYPTGGYEFLLRRQPGRETRISKPPPRRHMSKALIGQHGAKHICTFRYRSRLALQYLGCIPTTPPPVPLLERAPAEMTDEEKAGEILRMRTEILFQKGDIAELSRANEALHREIEEAKQIKERMTILQAALGSLSAVTTPNTTASAAVTPTWRTPSIKRERLRTEGQDDSVASTSHPAKRSKPVYVELDD